MSNRTSEANKAIALAWSHEQQLVREGKGTRDWTPEQQQDILERGKAYGDDGKAFEGHHMKSAERFPEYQGEPDNIQFLSRLEHFAAHDGNFQNPTNGCFDPFTGETIDFGLSKYEPCEVVELSEPVIQPVVQTPQTTENSATTAKISTGDVDIKAPNTSHSLKNPVRNRFVGTVKNLTSRAIRFYVRHKGIIDPVAAIVGTTVVVIREVLSGDSKNRSSDYDENDSDYPTCSSSNDVSGEGSDSVHHSEVIERTSPSEHTVSAHRQRYNGEWRDKTPYKRGKNSDE